MSYYERLQGKAFTDVKNKYTLDKIVVTDNGHLKGYYLINDGVSKEDVKGHDKIISHYLSDFEVKGVKSDTKQYHEFVEKGFNMLIERVDVKINKLEKYISGLKREETIQTRTYELDDLKEERSRLQERQGKLLTMIDLEIKFEGRKVGSMKLDKSLVEKIERLQKENKELKDKVETPKNQEKQVEVKRYDAYESGER